jgi:hypothetical protein
MGSDKPVLQPLRELVIIMFLATAAGLSGWQMVVTRDWGHCIPPAIGCEVYCDLGCTASSVAQVLIVPQLKCCPPIQGTWDVGGQGSMLHCMYLSPYCVSPCNMLFTTYCFMTGCACTGQGQLPRTGDDHRLVLCYILQAQGK